MRYEPNFSKLCREYAVDVPVVRIITARTRPEGAIFSQQGIPGWLQARPGVDAVSLAPYKHVRVILSDGRMRREPTFSQSLE